VQGTIGSQGTQGVQGSTGSQGTQGVQGSTGSQGTQGLQGLQGFGYQQAQGPTGAQGIQGTQGPVGSTFSIQGVTSTLLSDETASSNLTNSTTETTLKTYTINSTDAAKFTNYKIEIVTTLTNTTAANGSAQVTWRLKTGATTLQTKVVHNIQMYFLIHLVRKPQARY
jgi:hypothetical protein